MVVVRQTPSPQCRLAPANDAVRRPRLIALELDGRCHAGGCDTTHKWTFFNARFMVGPSDPTKNGAPPLQDVCRLRCRRHSGESQNPGRYQDSTPAFAGVTIVDIPRIVNKQSGKPLLSASRAMPHRILIQPQPGRSRRVKEHSRKHKKSG